MRFFIMCEDLSRSRLPLSHALSVVSTSLCLMGLPRLKVKTSSLILSHPFRILQSTKRFTPRQLLLSPSALRTRCSPHPRSPALCCPSARKRWSVLFVHVVRAPRLGSPTSGRERVISALSRRHHVPLSIHQRRRPPTRPPTRPPIRRPRPSPELPYARRPPWMMYGEPPKPRSLSWP